jgi:glycosyltransferase involved in cell wall biosynthesis
MNKYILMLVPHEPKEDPRISWVTDVCSQISQVDIISSVYTSDKPLREYEDKVYTERINIYGNASQPAKFLSRVGSFLVNLNITRGYTYQMQEASFSSETSDRSTKPDSNFFGELFYWLYKLFSYNVIVSAIYRRSRAISLVPSLIICHDIYALIPAIKLKKIFGCPVLYDSHEYWPQADLNSPLWENKMTEMIERHYIKQTDAVITVSPQLAKLLERTYSLPKVLSVPNAEPFKGFREPSSSLEVTSPLRFLLQGRVSRGRGIEELLSAWCQLNSDKAILQLRCPQNEYLSNLCEKYKTFIQLQRIVILPAVTESELIESASNSDIGIIPYVGPNLNHIYACPNKLSQYMQAGLAILSSNTEFVVEVIDRYKCGLSYDPNNPSTLIRAVESFVQDPEQLNQMKRNSYMAAKNEFNWQNQSLSYAQVVASLYSK